MLISYDYKKLKLRTKNCSINKFLQRKKTKYYIYLDKKQKLYAKNRDIKKRACN